MLRYVALRLIQGVLVLFLLSIIIFVLARVSGDPMLLLLGEYGTEEQYKQQLKHWGLNKPLYLQYGSFISNAVRGDLGKSIRFRVPVSELVAERLPNSAKLAGISLLMAVVLSIPLGVRAAVNKGRLPDTFARVIAALGQATPIFWLGLMLMLVFAVILKIVPTSGMGDWRSYILPGFCLAWFTMAGIIRLLRGSMLEVLDSEYIKMARIKGVPETVVVWKHALRNSLLPVVSFGGFYFALLITSSVVTETVFAWPGFGLLIYQGIIFRDYPIIQGTVLTAAVIVVASNLLTDILYAYLDPRIRYTK